MEKKYSDFSVSVRSDVYRVFGAWSVFFLIKALILKRTFRPVFSMRLCQLCISNKKFKILLPFFKVIHKLFTGLAGMDFSWMGQIGPGLVINHGWGCVIGAGVVIGTNATIFHGVTLGRRRVFDSGFDGDYAELFPKLGDDVWVGPEAMIFGGVTIGEGTKIAPGAYVTNDVEAHSLVLGNPSNIVKRNVKPDVNNRVPWL